jgi:phosphoribosylformylglycinamidine cyclo-ligase
MNELTYRKAGVDIDEGERFVKLIAPMVKRTFRPEVMTDIGSFSALFMPDFKRYKEPVLVSGTDGVGTKLKIAFMMDRHNTVGIDLVAMCVNDILTCGAEPLFFLDYLATGRLRPEKASEIIEGVALGCREAGCSLIGGETAEMPGFYAEGEYDIAGFAVGIVDRQEIVNGSNIMDGDVIIGIASEGLHSNGYSLARRLFFQEKGMSVNARIEELGCTIGEELLKPTRIYVKAYTALKEAVSIKGMAHITGGGLTGNLPRILPEGITARIKDGSWPVPPVFQMIESMGNIDRNEMRRTFNLGIGYVMIVPGDSAGLAVSLLEKSGYIAYEIGSAEKGGGGVEYL